MEFSSENYEALINGLFERHQSVQSAGFSPSSYKPGLDAMRRFDAALGNPSAQLRVIHVAGTNGKGSVCAMIAAALASQGFRVGLYTSPHLLDFRERIKIVDSAGFSLIPERAVWDFVRTYSSALENLSFFEITTGMAFHWFAQSRLDYAVLETGLGGRLDSTNIVTPLVSVITSIGLDHCAILGESRALIAGEKAGIFKRGVPAVVASRDDETASVFERAASDSGAALRFADSIGTFPCERGVVDTMDIEGPCREINVHTALVALSEAGFSVQAAAEGMSRAAELTGLRGRWERVASAPETIADIGHNPPALDAVFAKLERMRGSGASRRPLLIVYGVMKDKDFDSISSILPADAVYFLCAPSTERAMDVAELGRRFRALRPGLRCSEHRSVADALAAARSTSTTLDNPIIYIGGSTFVVSEALRK